MTKPVGWTASKPPPLSPLPQTPIPLPSTNEPLSSTPSPLSTHPPQVQARLLTAITQHHPPEVYIPHLESFNNPNNAAWPNFVAACLTPRPCALLSPSKTMLRGLKPADCDDMLPEPLRGSRYKPPSPGYMARLRVVPETRTSSVPTPQLRKPAVGEVIRLGTNMQPTLSRRKSASTTKPSLPRVRSMFLSGRKSEKARMAEEKEREEQEKAEREKAEKEREKEKEKEADAETGRELLDLTDRDSDLDFTIQDAAEIEQMEGMDETMIRTQRDKESRPRHVGEIVKKMHSTAPGPRNIVAAEADLPVLADTAYARGLRREEAAKKRHEQAEAAREKERVIAEHKREKFNRKRKRKLRKAGKIVQEESEDEETSPAPQEDASSGPPEEASNSTAVVDISNRESRRQRLEAPSGSYADHRSDDRYREHDDRRRFDYPQHHTPPHDARRHDNRAPDWHSPQHQYPHPPPPHYAPPSPYYAPPSPYYNYPPPPYYTHHPPPPPPPHHYYPAPRAPPRLTRDEYDRRKRELYEKIGHMCSQLHTDDARAIDDFLDNQDHMFRENENTKYFVLEQTRGEEVLLRIDRKTRTWEVVRKGDERGAR